MVADRTWVKHQLPREDKWGGQVTNKTTAPVPSRLDASRADGQTVG